MSQPGPFSLEDRIVKNTTLGIEANLSATIRTKKVLRATKSEVEVNPRSRALNYGLSKMGRSGRIMIKDLEIDSRKSVPVEVFGILYFSDSLVIIGD